MSCFSGSVPIHIKTVTALHISNLLRYMLLGLFPQNVRDYFYSILLFVVLHFHLVFLSHRLKSLRNGNSSTKDIGTDLFIRLNCKSRSDQSSSLICINNFLLCYSMNYRDFSVKSKLIISLFQTVKLTLQISLFEK